MIDVTCALIIDTQNRLFAVQRSSTMTLPLKWELPGGKVELDESSEECLIREIKEELEIGIEVIKNLVPSVYSYPIVTINLIPFICKQISGEITLKEHVDFKWLNTNELLDLDWAEADIPVLYQYLNYLDATQPRDL